MRYLVAILLAPSWLTAQTLRPSDEVPRAFRQLENALVQAQAQPDSHREQAWQGLLDHLMEVTHQASWSGVAIDAVPGMTLKAHAALLFGQTPVLPAETKQNGSWSFQSVRFDALSEHLYIYGLQLAGDHTIRLRRVTLFFQDHPPVVHDSWAALENGNGISWPKDTFTPMLDAWPEGQRPRAKRFAGMEILGSAQDGLHQAELAVRFHVPDPDHRPFRRALALMAGMHVAWADRTNQPEHLEACIQDLRRLAPMLHLTTCFGPPVSP